MPKMTRAHYNLIADATHNIIEQAVRLLPREYPEIVQQLRTVAATTLTETLAGTNSQFKADRFRERCLGIRGGR